MKKKIVLLLALLFVLSGYSQKSKGFDAHSYLSDYITNKDVKSLQNAKESIDQAAEHPETKDNAFVQITKGQIYLALYEETKKTEERSLMNIADENQRALAVFENTPTSDLETAYQAFYKGKQLDVKGKYKEELKAINTVGRYFDYSGRARFNAKKYAEAFSALERTYEISNYTDTTALYLCAVSADYSGNNSKAKEYYTKMIENTQAKPGAYVALANTYFVTKDTAGGLDALKKGRLVYPKNANLAMTEASYYSKLNRGTEVLDGLDNVIRANPTEFNLYLIRGNIYDNSAAQLKKSGDTTKQKNYDDNIKLAENDYLKVLQLDSANYYALFNLGILYYNKAVILTNQANNTGNKIKYESLNTKANEEFKKALPLLEKASNQKPKDRNILIALKQVYTQLKLEEDLKMVNERLKQ